MASPPLHRGREYGEAVDTVSQLADRYRQDLVTRLEVNQYDRAMRVINFHDSMTPRQFRARLKAEARRRQRQLRQASYDVGLDSSAFDNPLVGWLKFLAGLVLVFAVFQVLIAAILVLMAYMMGGFIPR
jgi:hypothetical protein